MVQTKLFSDLYLAKFLFQRNYFFHVVRIENEIPDDVVTFVECDR